METIEKYFAGERLQCTLGIIFALICIFVSGFFFFQQKAVLKGVSYSVIPLSVILMSICIGIVIRTPKDLTRVTSFYNTEREKMKTDELPRMERVMNNFGIIKKVELGILVISVLLAFFFWKQELIRGIALGVTGMSIILFLFDYVAAMRGKPYFEFLKSV